MLFFVMLFTTIQQTISISCQTQYKTKFISISNDYTSIETKPFINWFYQKFIKMNIQFPWNLIGQQLDQFNKTSFLTQFTFQLISNNAWIFGMIFLLTFLFIFFITSSMKSFCKSKQKQSPIKHPSSWNNEFEEGKFRVYSHAYNTLQSAINNDYHSKQRKPHHILYKSIYSIFLICVLLTSGLLVWMIIIIIKGITIETKLRDYMQKSSFELISFIEHTTVMTNCYFNSSHLESRFTNETLHINSQIQLAFDGVSFLTNIFSDLSTHLQKLEKLFDLWSIIRLITIIFAVIFLILCGFVFYLFVKKLHWSSLKSFQYTKFALILSIIYWIGFVLWFTKFILLLPHVAGACSACKDLKQKQVYNSLLYASTWFNSTFLSAMDNESIDIDQLIEKCEENLPLWSINDFIRLALLENKTNVEELDFNQYHRNYSKSERYFGHCHIFHELHNNFAHLFCHAFVEHLLHYLLTSLVTVISHFILYLITNLLRRFIQDHKYQFGRLNFAIRSSPILATDRSMIIPSNQNKHDEIEKKEYQKCSNNS